MRTPIGTVTKSEVNYAGNFRAKILINFLRLNGTIKKINLKSIACI